MMVWVYEDVRGERSKEREVERPVIPAPRMMMCFCCCGLEVILMWDERSRVFGEDGKITL